MLIGIVGKPSSGKSTLINALCNAEIAKMGNYPFTTIDSNRGVGYAYKSCVCQEMETECGLCIKANSDQLRPIPIKIIDVAGLVPGAHEGRGRGNKFLADLSEADILIHVIDTSGSLNEEGEDVPLGSYDPIKDISFLEDEIGLWIAGILENGWDKVKRTAKSSRAPIDEVLTERLAGIKIKRQHIKSVLANHDLNLPVNVEDWGKEELIKFAMDLRKISKPIVLVANKMDRPTSSDNFEKLKIAYPETTIIPASALSEFALQNLVKKDKITYNPLSGEINYKNISDKEKITVEKIKENISNKYGSTGIPILLTKCVEILGYIAVFPVADVQKLTDNSGKKILPDVYLVPSGTSVKNFAEYIHKDLYDNFICGIDARTNRKLSDNHELNDRDIIKIVSSK